DVDLEIHHLSIVSEKHESVLSSKADQGCRNKSSLEKSLSVKPELSCGNKSTLEKSSSSRIFSSNSSSLFADTIVTAEKLPPKPSAVHVVSHNQNLVPDKIVAPVTLKPSTPVVENVILNENVLPVVSNIASGEHIQKSLASKSTDNISSISEEDNME